MADVEVATAAPPPHQLVLAPPPERGRAAMAAWALYRFLSLASEAAVCFLLAAIWTCSVANAICIATRWVFGAGSLLAIFGEEYFDLALYAVFLIGAVDFFLVVALGLHCFVMFQLLRRRQRREGEARETSGEYAATIAIFAAALERDHQEGTEDEDDDPVGTCGPVTVILLLMGMGVGLLIVLLAPAPGSWQEWLGAVLFEGSFFLLSVVFCYVVFPSIAAGVLAYWDKVRDDAAILTYLYIG